MKRNRNLNFVLTLKCRVPHGGIWAHYEATELIQGVDNADEAEREAIANRAPCGGSSVHVHDCERVEMSGPQYTERHRVLLRRAHDCKQRRELERVNARITGVQRPIKEQRCAHCGLLLDVHQSRDEGSWYSSHLGDCPVQDVGAPFQVRTMTRVTLRDAGTHSTLSQAKCEVERLTSCNYPGLHVMVTDRKGMIIYSRSGTATPSHGNVNEFPMPIREIGED